MKPAFLLCLFSLCILISVPCYAQDAADAVETETKKKSVWSRLKGKSKKQKRLERLAKASPSYIDGRLTNEATSEALSGAYIYLPSKGALGVSNENGYFQLKAIVSDAQVKAIHPDVFDNFYNISIHRELYTPIGAVRLKPIMIGESLQAHTNYREDFSSKILAKKSYSALDILKQNGTPDFNQLLNNSSAVDKIDRGGSFGSSELRLRGFSAKLTQVNFNGININDAETESFAGHLYTGIGNWARKVSLTKGAPTSSLSATQPAGFISIEGFMPRQQAGVDAQLTYGSGNYMQTAVGLHSGTTKEKNLAASLKIDRTNGKGINKYTEFETLGAYLTLFAKTHQQHRFNMNAAFRYWNRQLNSIPLYSIQADRTGYDFNSNWDHTNINEYSAWKLNDGYSLLTSFHHEWKINKESQLISSAYAQSEQENYRDTVADFAHLQENSQSLRLGFQSRYVYRADAHTTCWLAADFDYFQKDKQGNSDHILAYVPFYTSADTFQFQQKNVIYKFGLTAHFQKQLKRWLLLTEAAAYYKGMQQHASGHDLEPIGRSNRWGYRALGGGSFFISNRSKLKLQLSVLSNPPSHATIFPTYRAWQDNDLNNRITFGSELAYAYQLKNLDIEVRTYSYQINNLAYIQNYGLNNQTALIHEIAQKHQGVELNTNLRYGNKHSLQFSAGYNNYTYNRNAQANFYREDFTFAENKELIIKNNHLANSTPFRVYVENNLMLLKGLVFNVNYQHNFGIYTSSLNANNVQQQLLSGYGLLGAEFNYYKDFRRPGSRLHIFFRCNNILDVIYSNQIWSAEAYPTSGNIDYPLYNSMYGEESNNIWAQFGLSRNWYVGIRYVL